MKTLNRNRILGVAALMVLAVVTRFLPHPPNFSAATSMVFVAPLFLGFSIWSFALPFAALILSDLVLGFYPGASFVYLGYLSVALVGLYQWRVFSGKSPRLFKGLSFIVSLCSSAVFFFVLSNLGVWLFGGIYSRDLQGFLDCYILAIPFFQNTLVSHVLFSTAFSLLPMALVKRFAARAEF